MIILMRLNPCFRCGFRFSDRFLFTSIFWLYNFSPMISNIVMVWYSDSVPKLDVRILLFSDIRYMLGPLIIFMILSGCRFSVSPKVDNSSHPISILFEQAVSGLALNFIFVRFGCDMFT